MRAEAVEQRRLAGEREEAARRRAHLEAGFAQVGGCVCARGLPPPPAGAT